MADPIVHRGAGILFITPERKALFLKRGPGGDAPGAWCFPGGTTEAGETAEQTAIREAGEELGSFPKGSLSLHTRAILPIVTINAAVGLPNGGNDSVDFSTFVQRVDEEFAPKLNGEHTGWAWADVSEPPAPLHPGCQIALDRLTWDELGVARAMRDGLLTSPQLYGNVWLFDMRVTGTGVSYRGPKYDENGKEISAEEFVYRRPENYLTEEFLARCNGLAVIMMHPPKSLLNSQEFGARVVGAMMLPYIKGDEVWGIAKVYDDDAVKLLTSKQMSTSPAVLLGNGDNRKLKTEDGTDLLIEGKPSLLDHLAICERGVWDKGGDPSGIRTDNQGEAEMTKEQLEALQKQIGEMVATAVAGVKTELLSSTALARADESGGQKLDKVLSAIDAFCGKMDAFEKKMDAHGARMDTEEERRREDSDEDDVERMDGESDEDFEKRKKVVAADKAKKDSEEKAAKEKADAEEKARKDAEEEGRKKADAVAAENADLRKRLEAVERGLPKQLTDEDRHAFGAAQARADDAYQGFGKRAPYPLLGEDVPAYQRRLAHGLKEFSPMWKDVDVLAIADAATFKIAEAAIYKDAAVAALSPPDLKDDELRAIVRVDERTGLRTTEYRGKHSFVRRMTRPSQRVTNIGVNRPAA